jgi:hypothetical protein
MRAVHWSAFVGRGTALNVASVVAGSLLGLAAGSAIPARFQEVATFGIGLITIGLGVQMFLRSKNPLVVVAAICLGGVLGSALGLDVGLEALAEWARVQTRGEGRFNEGFITASVLFCIGPMTLLGCLQDALERKIELLALKSLLDGVSSVFLAAALGVGVLVSAAFVLVFQGLLTLLAVPLKRYSDDEAVLGEVVACGGVMMMAIGLGIAGITSFETVLFLPSLVVAPLCVRGFQRIGSVQKSRELP